MKLKRCLRWLTIGVFIVANYGKSSWGFLPMGASRRANKPGVLYYSGDKKVKQVALTFDDGPCDPYTGQILDVLKAENVKATFFMVGKHVLAHPMMAKRVVMEGHAVGNHTFSHFDYRLLTRGRIRKDIFRCQSAIEGVTGVRPILFRPPHGWLSAYIMRVAKEMGFVTVQWSLSPRDWRRPPGEKIVRRIVQNVHNGSIILLHDGVSDRDAGDRSQTVKALPELIESLRAEGYEFVTVPELLKLELPEVQTAELNLINSPA